MNARLSSSYQRQRNAFGLPNLQFSICIFQFAILFLVGAAPASAATRVEAYRGEPFGIGRVTIDLEPGSAPASDDRFILAEANNRVLYPAMKNSSARRILRGLLGIETPLRLTYLFMFRGDEPLDLIAYTPEPQSFTARPTDNARRVQRLAGRLVGSHDRPLSASLSRGRVSGARGELHHGHLGSPAQSSHARTPALFVRTFWRRRSVDVAADGERGLSDTS